MKNVIFVGGGEIGKGETEKIDIEVKKMRRKDLFLYFLLLLPTMQRVTQRQFELIP
ncbi:MAG TPA: hypothetical protein VFV22_01180 [Candidatus Paceibacterota bacterium]|nr:hypothetical protein [Candidatus Paceibacterota bacterium]